MIVSLYRKLPLKIQFVFYFLKTIREGKTIIKRKQRGSVDEDLNK